MTELAEAGARAACAGCGTQLDAAVLSCPSCGALAHADRLRRLAASAESATAAGDLSGALAAWREALDLLPAGTTQRATISARIAELSERAGTPAEARSERGSSTMSLVAKGAAGAGAIGLLLFKFKWVLIAVATKGKLLLLGLTKGSTFFSMLLSLGVYWTAFGWKFALGLVLSIYVHEMGHVAMLRRYGIKSTAPMFIPGLGALIRMQQYPQNPREDARVGLAGPVWGLGAAVCAWIVFRASGLEIFGAIAQVGAWINLFNLIPVWQLDGSRGFASLVRSHRWVATGAIALAWFATEEGLLLLLLIPAVFRAFGRNVPERADTPILAQYVGLVLVLAWMTTISVTVG